MTKRSFLVILWHAWEDQVRDIFITPLFAPNQSSPNYRCSQQATLMTRFFGPQIQEIRTGLLYIGFYILVFLSIT